MHLKGQGLSVQTIFIVVIAIIALAVISMFALNILGSGQEQSETFTDWSEGFKEKSLEDANKECAKENEDCSFIDCCEGLICTSSNGFKTCEKCKELQGACNSDNECCGKLVCCSTFDGSGKICKTSCI